MHISDPQQSPNTILTQCSKMTEEGHRRHGMNGNADGAPREEGPKTNYVQGGRLKFFKDGKFILELERAREGERVSWVSVPRKSFYSPQGTAASTPTYRQESSTSLSVSDDNSSIQSSPWQRDHSWKQPTPRRNLSKELTFYFRVTRRHRRFGKSRKRRRPYSSAPEAHGPDESKVLCNDRITTSSSPRNSACNNNNRVRRCKSIHVVIETLLARCTPPRNELVSPRKRFLREMEKDKLSVDECGQKRSRCKTSAVTLGATSTAAATTGTVTLGATTSTAAAAAAVTSVTAKTIKSPARVNGSIEDGGSKPPPATTTTVTKNCSYSITSLLADDRNTRRSPSSSPSHYVAMTQPQYCAPSPDDRWYSDSVDKMRSMDLSQAEKRAYPGFHHPSYVHPPYLYQYALSPYYGPNPGLYGRGYMLPPVYHAPHVQMPGRHEVPTCSWTAEAVEPRDVDHRDENVADMPLNLSKHAG